LNLASDAEHEALADLLIESQPDARGQCVNHDCGRFEHVVLCQRGGTCESCGSLLLAPNGVDYAGEEAA
jgi:hypothetical protein